MPETVATRESPTDRRQRRFAEEYVVDCNGTRAAIRAGYAPASARSTGAELLKIPRVAAMVADAQAAAAAKTAITAENALRQAARNAFYDIRDVFDPDGSMIPVPELPDAIALTVQSVKVTRDALPGGEVIATTVEYKFPERSRALEVLMKHLGLFEKDNEQKADKALGTLLEILAASKAGRLQAKTLDAETIEVVQPGKGAIVAPLPDGKVAQVARMR